MNLNHKNIMPYLYDSIKTFCIFIIATYISYLMVDFNDVQTNVTIIYILAVIIVSRITSGYLWGILTSFAGALGTHYFFTFPYFKFDLSRSGYPFTFFSMLFTSLIISTMTANIMKHVRTTQDREEKTKKLNEISNKLLATNGLDQIIELTLDYVVEFTNRTVVFYTETPQSGKEGVMKSRKPEHERNLISSHEQFIANWVFEHKLQAGVGTDYSSKASCIYLPLISHQNVRGVLGIYCINQKPLEDDDLTFLNLMLSLVAMAIERQHLSDNQQHMTLETEKEKMRANLLRAVSHDLRTPLTGMIGASATLMENRKYLSKKEKEKLTRHIHEDSNWLLHMVENLLSVTRINEDNSTVNKTPEPLEEVVAEAVMRFKKRYPEAAITVKAPYEFLLVPMDATLIEQVILNLAENAIKYSKSDKPVELLVTKESTTVLFHVIDYGIGIAEDKLEVIFDGYSQHKNDSIDSSKGIGIGLSICKTIINAHGGTITAKNQVGGGAIFTFSLPLEGDLDHE